MNKKKFKVLITWRLLIDKFFLYKKFFEKNKILYDLLYTDQYLKEIDSHHSHLYIQSKKT